MSKDKENVLYAVLEKEYAIADHGKGCYIYDTNGKEYLDCAAGVAVVNIGHGVQEVIDAIKEQAEKISYVYGGTFTSQARTRLAEQVIEMAPPGMERVFFCSGGSEAIESVIKIARQYQVECGRSEKHKIISRWQSYHGNTLATLSVGGRTSWREIYDPYLLNNPHIPQCNCLYCPYGASYPHCEIRCAQALEQVICSEGPNTVAAFLLEPIIGTTAAATVPPKEYLSMIRRICDKYDVLLCCDEVITGLGRTGKNFAVDHFGVIPDLIGTAKALGGGYMPMGAVIVHKKIIEALHKGSGKLIHSFTFASNPLACAAASAVLKYTNDYNLVENAAKMGDYFLKRLQAEIGDLPMVGDIRGIGLMIGIEFVKNRETMEPYHGVVGVSEQVANCCFEKGLVVISGIAGTKDGVNGEALQISPPLVITKTEIDRAVSVLKEAILQVREMLEAAEV